ncbi:hypothetical protein MKW98_004378 [Papaver atlanticum]|uniref:Uncharacterized protein n=1 Tax=Papaver atlanticum TaxID=357466 RepID=A0AAD4SN28_9MAGN|nr:hypothetical protein MKW98_004378 [Papaver atlanticum]
MTLQLGMQLVNAGTLELPQLVSKLVNNVWAIHTLHYHALHKRNQLRLTESKATLSKETHMLFISGLNSFAQDQSIALN